MGKAKTQIAYEAIKQKILTGEFKEGRILNEEELQHELDISRTPVREAIKRLESERHVIVFPRKGTVVASIDLKLINNVYQVRRMIEPYAVKLACPMISKEWLKDIKERFLKLSDNYSVGEYIALDTEFHEKIIEVQDNIMLEDAMAIVYDHDQRLRLKNSHLNRIPTESVDEHIKIIEAILDDDEDKAGELMLQHILKAKEVSIKSSLL